MGARDGLLKARDFLFACEEQAVGALAAADVPPDRRVMWTTLQFSYGDRAVHFELQPQPARGLVELGLHFEGPLELNDLWAAHIAAHAGRLLGELGSEWELEAWTLSWRRLHRTFPGERLTSALASEVGAELARAIRVLGPVIREGLPVAAPSLSAAH